MISSIHTMSVSGICGSMVRTECYITNGLPAFDIVGLPDAAVKEARERVRAAAKHLPGRRRQAPILICRFFWVYWQLVEAFAGRVPRVLSWVK